MKFTKKSIVGALGAFVLGIGAIVFAQTQFTEVNDLMFRSRTPQVRASGNISVRDLAGTAIGAVSFGRPAIVTTGTTVTRTLLYTECGAVIIDNGSSSTQTYTLPAVANAGCQFTFIAGDAGGEILVNSAASATCVITSFAAVGADADTGIITDTSCNTGLKNTAATNAIGDSLTLISDGTRWLGVGITSGIWAAQ